VATHSFELDPPDARLRARPARRRPFELDPPDADSPELDPPDADSPELDRGAVSPAFDGLLAFFFAEAAEDRRSFLAQPLPLKWIVGGTKARVTRPSQRGHW
jgi:hypothetical protein